jgi:hypothetical protein
MTKQAELLYFKDSEMGCAVFSFKIDQVMHEISQTIESLLLGLEKGLNIAPISCIAWSIFKLQK